MVDSTESYTTVSGITCINFLHSCFLENMRYRGQCCECAAGWAGYDCATPICNPGCLHGTCINYNTCKCSSTKWIGTLCETPVCPTCVHGICTEPDHCECFYGYNGSLCDTRTFVLRITSPSRELPSLRARKRKRARLLRLSLGLDRPALRNSYLSPLPANCSRLFARLRGQRVLCGRQRL